MNLKPLCLLALTTLSAIAWAGDNPEFKAVDTDADGFISFDEARKVEGLVDVFPEVDVDRDGKLSEAEYGESSQS